MNTNHTPGVAPGRAPHSRLSWGAVLAGVVLAIAVQLVLGILGAGIGLSLVDPVEGTTPGAGGFGIGAGLYWIVSTIVALGVGGYAAARVAGVHDRFDGLVHGLVIWGLTLLLTLYLLTSAIGGIVGGAFRTIGSVAGAAGQGIGAAAPKAAEVAGIDTTDVQQQADAYLQTAPSDPALMTPQEAQKEIARALPDLATGGVEGRQAENRIVQIVAAQAKISPAEAQQRVDQAQARFEKTKADAIATAKSAADASANAASKTSFMLFVALLIGAASAGFGGIVAVRRRRV